jgi:Protein of unknown function (DUF1569)
MKYQKVKSTNFFDKENYQALVNRLQSIDNKSKRLWGQMTPAQMLHHLNVAIGSGLGFYQVADVSNWASRNVVKFLVLKVLKSFPKNAETASTLKVIENYDFETEKKQLFFVLEKAYKTQQDSDWGKHTLFGTMTRQEWGALIMIHCNHHFQQFSN